MTMKSDLRKSAKRRGKRIPFKNDTPEKDKIRGTVVQLLWSAAAPGLKPLRLLHTQMEVHIHLKKAFPGRISTFSNTASGAALRGYCHTLFKNDKSPRGGNKHLAKLLFGGHKRE